MNNISNNERNINKVSKETKLAKQKEYKMCNKANEIMHSWNALFFFIPHVYVI